jgi:hypothetical protein
MMGENDFIMARNAEGSTGNSIVTNYSSSPDRRKSEAARDLP